MAKSKGGRADQITADLRGFFCRFGQGASDLEKGLVRAEVFLALIAGQFQCDNRDGQAHHFGHAAGIVLNEFCGAGGPDDHRFWLETVIGSLTGGLEEIGGVGPKVARLKRGVGDGRAVVAPLDHGKEQVGIGIALRCVQDVMQPLHRGCDAHRADMRRAFIGPKRELHDVAPSFRAARRRIGREKSPARSPACS